MNHVELNNFTEILKKFINFPSYISSAEALQLLRESCAIMGQEDLQVANDLLIYALGKYKEYIEEIRKEKKLTAQSSLDKKCTYSLFNYHGYDVCFWYGLDYCCDKECSKKKILNKNYIAE